MEKPLKIRLQILSPVHIGCDNVYEPTNFVIEESKQTLIGFDPLELISALDQDEKAEFTDVCMGDNLLNIFKFIKKRYKQQIGGRKTEVTPDLLKHYRKILNMSNFDKKTVINQFEIGRTAYNPNNNIPYIPGSSLKGALRTAYLSKLAKDKGVRKWWERPGKKIKDKNISRDLEKSLLKCKLNTDPFRLIKVSDLKAVNDINTKIVYAVNRKKKQSKFTASGPFQILETIQSGEIFEGVINIEKPERDSEIINPITKEAILNSLDYFYNSICKDENENTLKNIEASSKVFDFISSQSKDIIGKSSFLIRIGRHSGAESVTIENNRHIKIMKGRGEKEYSNQATTVWLASESNDPKNDDELLPFGWAILTIGEQSKNALTITTDITEDNEPIRKQTPKVA